MAQENRGLNEASQRPIHIHSVTATKQGLGVWRHRTGVP